MSAGEEPSSIRLMSVEAARERMLGLVSPMATEMAPIGEALGRALAAPVLATRAQPPFPASAMDGWAVRRADAGAPRRIVGESAAGRGFTGELAPGEAVRIFTGAPVPAGADLVIVQEEARVEDGRLIVSAPAAPEAQSQTWIRPAGMDFAAGDRLLESGVVLDPWRLALAAASGAAQLAVRRRPRVAVLATGEEVVPPGAAPGPFQIFESGSSALASLTRLWGAEAILLPIAGDDEAAIADAAQGARADLLITLGGASVGDHDLVKPALRRLGLELAVESVALRPGKPTWAGRLADGGVVLGLPGNPASAMVCAELFLRPVLRRLLDLEPRLPMVMARLQVALPANGPREHWMRAELSDADGVRLVRPFGEQDSSLVGIFARADALVRRPVKAPAAEVGELVEVLRLDRAG